MENNKKNSTIAGKQNSGISSINIIKILAFIKLNFKYIFFTALFSIISMCIAEIVGRYIAYIVWG